MSTPLLPSVEDRLVLPLRIGPAQGERVLAKITNVDQWPPADVKALYKVCNSDDDMHINGAA
jgi:hypothetical protein